MKGCPSSFGSWNIFDFKYWLRYTYYLYVFFIYVCICRILKRENFIIIGCRFKKYEFLKRNQSIFSAFIYNVSYHRVFLHLKRPDHVFSAFIYRQFSKYGNEWIYSFVLLLSIDRIIHYYLDKQKECNCFFLIII